MPRVARVRLPINGVLLAILVLLGASSVTMAQSEAVLHVTLFRSGFLGLFLIDRGMISHIDSSSSES